MYQSHAMFEQDSAVHRAAAARGRPGSWSEKAVWASNHKIDLSNSQFVLLVDKH